ncbi:hypothetical protein [Sphingomonas tagetis]|nr:hypothetical protein [Sphingomonas tagetis]
MHGIYDTAEPALTVPTGERDALTDARGHIKHVSPTGICEDS